MTLTPEVVFNARPELRSHTLGDVQTWAKNVLKAAEARHQAEQVEVYQLDPALTGIALPFSVTQLEQVRGRVKWLPLLESVARSRGWHYVQVDFARSALVLAMYNRVCYVHLAGEKAGAPGVAVGLLRDEVPEAVVERLRLAGVWEDTENGRVWHSPDMIANISFPADSLLPLD